MTFGPLEVVASTQECGWTVTFGYNSDSGMQLALLSLSSKENELGNLRSRRAVFAAWTKERRKTFPDKNPCPSEVIQGFYMCMGISLFAPLEQFRPNENTPCVLQSEMGFVFQPVHIKTISAGNQIAAWAQEKLSVWQSWWAHPVEIVFISHKVGTGDHSFQHSCHQHSSGCKPLEKVLIITAKGLIFSRQKMWNVRAPKYSQRYSLLWAIQQSCDLPQKSRTGFRIKQSNKGCPLWPKPCANEPKLICARSQKFPLVKRKTNFLGSKMTGNLDAPVIFSLQPTDKKTVFSTLQIWPRWREFFPLLKQNQ